MRTIEYIIGEEYNEKKLYAFLKGKIKMSSKLIRTLKTFDDGLLLNGEHIRTIDPVFAGDRLTVNIHSNDRMSIPGDTLPDVLYEDDDILVVNKPAMLAIHESHNHQGDTLANCVALHLQNEGKHSAFRAVGRLDKGTSGVVVCALNPFSAAKLNAKLDKTYLAIAVGHYDGTGTIDRPIYRPDPMKTIRTVDERGEKAVTHYRTIKYDNFLTSLEITLETGRTHQIRVHFASMGTPLLGDRMYGEPEDIIGHQALHCSTVKLIHPVTEEPLTFTAPLPNEYEKYMYLFE